MLVVHGLTKSYAGPRQRTVFANVHLELSVGDSFGTLSEVALGRQFGKLVIGLEGASLVDGVQHVAGVADAVRLVAEYALSGR